MLNLSSELLMPVINNILIVSGAFYFIAGFLAFIEGINNSKQARAHSHWAWVLFISLPVCIIQLLYYFGFTDFLKITLDIFYINNIFTRNLAIIMAISMSAFIVGLKNCNIIQIKHSRIVLGLIFILASIYEYTHHVPYLAAHAVIHYESIVSQLFSISLSLTGLFYLISLYTKRYFIHKLWSIFLMTNGLFNLVILPNHLHPFEFKQQEPFCFYQFTLNVFLIIMLVISIISLSNKYLLSKKPSPQSK